MKIEMPESDPNETVAERRARWLSVGTSAEALPTRAPQARSELSRTKTWEREHDAARELARNGVEVPQLAKAPGLVKALNDA